MKTPFVETEKHCFRDMFKIHIFTWEFSLSILKITIFEKFGELIIKLVKNVCQP